MGDDVGDRRRTVSVVEGLFADIFASASARLHCER